MRIGILSDTHLGFAWGTPRQDDSFTQAEEAINLLLDKKVDVILHAGDIFESSIPRPEVMARALHIFAEPALHESPVKPTSFISRSPPKFTPRGIPVIAIHGTHERRPRGLINPVELLERSGLCVYLHCSGVVLDDKVAVYGMGGVPERYALDVLKGFEPKPVRKENYLLIHQTIREIFNPPGEPATITLSDLPQGMTTICGHIHWSTTKPGLILPGSTIQTQLNKDESYKKKILIIEDGKLEELFLETPRPFHYQEVRVDGKKPQEIVAECERFLDTLKDDNRSIIRLKLVGTLTEGFEPGDIKLEHLRQRHPFLYIDKSVNTTQLIAELPKGAGLDDLLMKALEKSIASRGLRTNTQQLCDYLIAGNIEKIIEVLGDDTEG